MNVKKIIGYTIGAAVVVFLILGIARSRSSEEVQSVAKIHRELGVPVFAETVTLGTVQQLHSYYGTIHSKDQASVSAKMQARVQKVSVREGDQVKKGDLLIRYDASNSQVMLTQAKLQYQNMKRDYERMKDLLSKGAISQQNFDQVELGYRVSKENYDNALSAVELTAPISGIVGRVNVIEGAISNPGDIVVQLINDNAYEVQFDATQDDRDILRPGQEVFVHAKSGDDIRGKVTKVSFSTSEMTRLFTASADIPSAPNLYPGVLATVDVVVEEHKDVLTVPVDAVVDRGHGPEVIVVTDNTADPRSVILGLRGADTVEILEGVKPGETIATYGHKTLSRGDKVRIIEDSGSSVTAG